MMLIDPPSPFASKEEWEKFLKQMKEALTDAPDEASVKEHIALAEKQLKS